MAELVHRSRMASCMRILFLFDMTLLGIVRFIRGLLKDRPIDTSCIPYRKKIFTGIKFRYFANGKFDKFKLRLLLYLLIILLYYILYLYN